MTILGILSALTGSLISHCLVGISVVGVVGDVGDVGDVCSSVVTSLTTSLDSYSQTECWPDWQAGQLRAGRGQQSPAGTITQG